MIYESESEKNDEQREIMSKCACLSHGKCFLQYIQNYHKTWVKMKSLNYFCMLKFGKRRLFNQNNSRDKINAILGQKACRTLVKSRFFLNFRHKTSKTKRMPSDYTNNIQNNYRYNFFLSLMETVEMIWRRRQASMLLV